MRLSEKYACAKLFLCARCRQQSAATVSAVNGAAAAGAVQRPDHSSARCLLALKKRAAPPSMHMFAILHAEKILNA